MNYLPLAISLSDSAPIVNSQFGSQPDNYMSIYEFYVDEIKGFTQLGKNWDGYRSTPISQESEQSALQFLHSIDSSWIDRISDVFPNPHGTVTFEWETAKKGKLVLELGEKNFSYFRKDCDNQPKFVDGQNNFPNIKELQSDLDQLFSKDLPALFLA